MKSAIVLACGMLAASSSFAARNTESVNTETSRVLSGRATQAAPHLIAGTYKQAIDHTGLVAGQTFDQRYWVDSEFATSGANAPVIYHICGEGDATDGYFLNDNAVAWAKTLGAHLVYLEHRYYGKSLPFSDLSTDHLKYLTLNNVLEDLATFQKWVANTNGWTGKWISVGGSYSATLSAIYRQVHPELVVGALAASAPMISGIGEDEGSSSDVSSLSSTRPSDDRPWVYQACTTFGFWEASGASLSGTLMTPSKWLCQQLFGNAPYVDTAAYNQAYSTPFITDGANAPSNILFTYGSQDVWTKLGFTAQSNHNPKITIQVISGAGHHFDLNAPTMADSTAVKNARNVFLTLAHTWLN